MKAHLLFEQSGTFKNEFKALGVDAIDYDIRNDFGETDIVCDLFLNIRGGYYGCPSIFDGITQDDITMAFFPCTQFEDQKLLSFSGAAYGFKGWTDEQKLDYCMRQEDTLHEYYQLVSMLAMIAFKRGLKLIIENPRGTFHYLNKYWCLKPSVIDKDRRLRGDYYKKPTQYWFIGCEPKNNVIFEPMVMQQETYTVSQGGVNGLNRTVARSMISTEYANRFIREYIL